MADIASITRQLNERGDLRFMAPPLTGAALADLEATYGVSLPPEQQGLAGRRWN